MFKVFVMSTPISLKGYYPLYTDKKIATKHPLKVPVMSISLMERNITCPMVYLFFMVIIKNQNIKKLSSFVF